ncbi:MAG: hypothetical protein Tp172DCM1112201_15 [Prokaryotic dsDNA virus sp.]|nr:MAG: hypothetical protein Tp172DCM1112201_15 [Prokaryotic dsDNA virus sp.]|tara:strand:- start:5106 stop:10934 length:5829 start_codon:yes stop_codon:yes gene_type:complete
MADDIVQAFRSRSAGAYSPGGIFERGVNLEPEEAAIKPGPGIFQEDAVDTGRIAGLYADPSLYEEVDVSNKDNARIMGYGAQAGAHTVDALHHKLSSLFYSLAGNEEAVEEALFQAGNAEMTASRVKKVDASAIFADAWDEETWGGFLGKVASNDGWRAMQGFAGEALPTMGVVIADTIVATAIGGIASILTGGAAIPAGAAGITAAAGAAVTKQGAKKIVAKRLLAADITEQSIREAVEASLRGLTLTNKQNAVMNAVYANYRTKMKNKTLGRWAMGGAFEGSYRLGAGTIFGEYAEQGYTDPVSAWKSLGLAVPFAAAELAADVTMFKALRAIFPRGFAGTGLIEGVPRTPGSIVGNVFRSMGTASGAEMIAETTQAGIESSVKMGVWDQERLPADDPSTKNFFEDQIDPRYSKEQMKLDLATSAFAGFSAGLSIGGLGGSAGGIVSSANNWLQKYQINRTIKEMTIAKFGGLNEGKVIPETKEQLWGAIETMMDPTNDIDTTWIEFQSLDNWAEIEKEVAEKYGTDAWFDVRLKSPIGGILLTKNQQKAESFTNIFSLNMPSQRLVDETLARILDFPRSRDSRDGWVVRVKDKKGNIVKSFQTNNPKEDGQKHLDDFKNKVFKNSKNYTYDIVDAETHLEEVQELGAEPVSFNDMQETLDDEGNIFEVEPQPVSDPENLSLGSIENPIRSRNNKPWAFPDEQYEDQFPDQDLYDEARLSTAEVFRAELDELFAQGKLSKFVLKKYLDLMDTQSTVDTTFKIEETENGVEILKYNLTAQADIDVTAEADSILRKARKRGRANKLKNKKASRWTLDGKPIDMPFAVTQMRNLFRRMGMGNNLFYGDLMDAFSQLYGELIEKGTLEYDGKPVTNENAASLPIYSQGGKSYTLKELQELAGQERDEGRTFGTDPKDRESNLEALIRELEQVLVALQDSGKSKIWWEYKNWTQEELETEIETKEGELSQLREEQSETTLEPTQEEKWDSAYEQWAKQPLSKMNMPKEKPIINGKEVNKKTKIEISNTVDELFGEASGFLKTIVEGARKLLGITKPILVFSTTESIDLGNARLNKIVEGIQAELQNDEKTKGRNIHFKDYDVIILNISPNATLETMGFYLKVLGHEIGHTFLNQLKENSLTNKALRNALLKEYKKDVAANPGIKQWQGQKGFDEWFSDKTASLLFDLHKGKIYKATNVGQSFLKKITEALKAFWDYITDGTAGKFITRSALGKERVAERFSYSESFAEFVNGLQTSQKEAQEQKDAREPGYEELAHVESLLESTGFGDKFGHKSLRNIEKLANRMLMNGKLPKWFKKIFDSAHGILFRMGPVGEEIANFFHKVSGVLGEEGFINAASGKAYEIINEIGEILGVNTTFTDEAKAVLEEASDETTATKDLSEKARKVRELLDKLYDDLELEKLGIKRRENFFPRLINLQEIAANEELRNALIDLLVKKNKGLTLKEATKIVEDLISKNESDEYNVVDEEGEYTIGMSRERSKYFENITFAELFEKKLVSPPEIALMEYVRKTVRRVEFEKRGGAEHLKKLVDQLSPEEQIIAQEAINAMLGKISPIKHDLWKKFTNWGLFYNVVSLLSMVVFASIPDAAGPVLRSRTLDVKTIVDNLFNSLTKEEGAQLAKSIGVNGLEAMMDMNLYQGETQQAQYGYAQKWTNGWFRFTQLERWTRWTRSFAAGMGRDFLIKHAKIVTDPNKLPGSYEVLTSKRYLEELGITGKEINEWVAQGQNLKTSPKIKSALRRFVDEAIVRPNSAERPIWASDPNFALVWQLKSFYYAYGKNIVGGVLRESRTIYGNKGQIPDAMYPLIMMALTVLPLTMIGWDLRERFKIGLAWLLPGISPADTDYRQSQSMSSGEYWFEVIDRGGIPGKYSLLFPLFMENRRYGDPFFVPMLGPTAEKTWNLVTLDTEIPELIPIYSNLNTSNFGGRNE